MRKAIVSNILYSAVEKIFLIGSQFVASVLLIRLLPRQDYGVIGVVVGYFSFISIINISLEAIILRDHQEFDKKIEKYIYNFLVFNILKSIVFLMLAIILSIFLVRMYSNTNFLYSIFSITVITIADALVTPLIVYQSVKFNQKLVTRISAFRFVLNTLILLGLFYFPTLKFVFIKDLITSIAYISVWLFFTIKILDVKRVNLKEDLDLDFIKKTLTGYSLWTHFNGVITNFIYRSDTFFLSLFVNLATVGNYNIALNSANVANVLPMILGYQNSVAISNVKEKQKAFLVSNTFIRFSAYLQIATFVVFCFFGKTYLYIITGEKTNQEIYNYMIFIVGALTIIKGIANPLVAYINIKGSVKSLFKNVLIPTGLFAVFTYFISAKLFGAPGVAMSNVIISLFWLLLLLREVVRYQYDFSTLFKVSNDYLYIKGYLKK